MKKESVDELCAALARWFPPSTPQPDPELAAILLDAKVLVRKENALRWRSGDVERLLLRTLPSEALLYGDAAPAVLGLLPLLLTFLEQSGRMTKDSATVDELTTEVSEGQLRTALDDRRLWGPNKLVLTAAADSGVDLEHLEEVEDFARAMLGFSPPPASGVELPARRLSPVPVLAQAARDTPAFALGVVLADWVGDGRAVRLGLPTKAVAQQAQDDLGLSPEELRRSWQLAWDWGLLDVGTRKARGTEAPATDEDWLSRWQDSFGVLLADPPEPEEDRIWHGPVDESLVMMLSLAYAVPEGLAHEDAVETAWELMVEEELRGVQPPPRSRGPWRAGLSEYLDERLDALRTLGAITNKPAVIELTPLGVAGVSWVVKDYGGTAQTFTSTAEMEAGEVLDLIGFCVEPVLEEWAADRDPHETARDLLEAASTRGPGARAVAFETISASGPAVHPIVERWTTHATLGPHARNLLADGNSDPQDALWLLVDLASRALDDEELLRQQFDQIPLPAFDELMTRLWRIDHPDAVGVLEALGRHDNKSRAKAARKAAFKAQSRH